jgi:Leucine-rich repeat (LRR) protein
MRNICFKDPTVFDNLPNLLNLELYLCSNQTSNKRLLDNLTKLEHLTIDCQNKQPAIDLIIPPNVKHLIFIFYQFTEKEAIALFSSVNLANIISLRIDCSLARFISIFDYDYEYYELQQMINVFASLGSLCTRLEIGKTHIPWISFIHLTNLTVFKCVDWRGKPDFDAFKPLVNLKTLDLSKCDLDKLPANIFVNQKQLETLILEGNCLEDLNCEAFNGLEILKVLNVKSNDLREFNFDKLNGILEKLTCLKEFYISELEIEDYRLIFNKLFNELDILAFDDEED